ncbi:hypothetical protein HDR60_04360 [bacterium]|nr:hypothetical protein [bacterium]
MNIGVIEKIYTIQFLVSYAKATRPIPALTRFEIRRTNDKNEIENIIKEVIQEQKTKQILFSEMKNLNLFADLP